MSYDLIAIDIDGTLVGRNHTVSDPVFKAIQRVKKAGKKIVLCTGRPFPGASPYMEELRLNEEGDYMITYHGALVQRTDTLETVIHHELGLNHFKEWHGLASSLNSNLHAVRNDGVFTDLRDLNRFALVEPYINNIPLRIRSINEFDSDLTYSKFLMADEFEIIQELDNHIPAEFRQKYTVVRSMDNTIEVLNKEASKGQSLRELATLLNIPQERVMAIGDSGNDIDMVEYAGLGVAMGNAIPAVKAAANVITDSNEEDGVATAINRYVFGE